MALSATVTRDPANEDHWLDFSHRFLLRADTTYLNHGSWGLPPNPVRHARREWIDQLDRQPMDFYLREYEPELLNARSTTADFVGTSIENLVFVENATFGMNVVADSYPLKRGDEVLLTDHEYGAVRKIWERACQKQDAKLVVAQLPEKIESQQQVVDCLTSAVTDRTQLAVFSHITSPTALVMPVEQLTSAFHDRDVAVCIDGPHAPAQVDIAIDAIGCDFYMASCHKWLCSTLGSGFLAVSSSWQDTIRPNLQSWGRLLPAEPECWADEFTWTGTRDPSPYLSIPIAIEFMRDQVGLDTFRSRSRYLAAQAESMLSEEFSAAPIARREDGWYASMAHVPLPCGDHSRLQQSLWDEYRIEVPISQFNGRWYIRVSCHLYNNLKQLETLRFAIRKMLL